MAKKKPSEPVTVTLLYRRWVDPECGVSAAEFVGVFATAGAAHRYRDRWLRYAANGEQVRFYTSTFDVQE